MKASKTVTIAIDFTSPHQMASHLAKYITCASTIHAHCVNSWGRSPSLHQIREYQREHRKPPKRYGDPIASDWYSPAKRPVAAKVVYEAPEPEPVVNVCGLSLQPPVGARVVEAVAKLYGVQVADMKGARRFKKLIEARFMAAKLLSEVTWEDGGRRFTYPQIGRIMGGRDHSTIIHAVQRFDYHLERDAELRRVYADMRAKLGIG